MKRKDNASKIATLLAVVNTVDHYLITLLLFPYCMHAKVASVMSNSLQPMDCSPPGSSVHGILQARILEWVANALLQGIFPAQGSNPHLLRLLHCRWILYH